MAKLKKKSSKPVKNSKAVAAIIKQIPVNSLVRESMIRYGTYVVEDRSIPVIQDGLKPVQRRVLWAMHDLGAKDSGYKLKCAKVVGQTMGSYHPHGDKAIYDSLVRFVTDIPYPIIFGDGNFGSHNDPPAAYRYTHCHFTKLGYKVYFNPYYLRVTETVPNYDGSTKEPVVLPALLPMILVIPQSGIAVGVSTTVPSFTLESVYSVVTKMFETGKVPSSKWLAKTLEWSSTFGGKVISSLEEKTTVIETGYGRIDWECDYSYDGKTTLTITGIPPGWNLDTKIAAISKESYIAECAEQTDKNGLKITVRFKRTDEEQLEENVQKFKKHLRSSQTISLNCILRSSKDTDGYKEPQSDFQKRSITEVLQIWFDWRIDLEKKALKYEAKQIKENIERDRLLEKTINHIDIIFALLKKKGIDKVKELANKMGITEDESKFIWSIAVGRLDRLSMDSVQQSIANSQKRLKVLKNKFENSRESVLDQLKSMKIGA